MDKELREKIADILERFNRGEKTWGREVLLTDASDILTLLKEAGYQKVSGEPSEHLLTAGEIEEVWKQLSMKSLSNSNFRFAVEIAVKQDVKSRKVSGEPPMLSDAVADDDVTYVSRGSAEIDLYNIKEAKNE